MKITRNIFFGIILILIISGCNSSVDENQYEVKGTANGLDGVKFTLVVMSKPGAADTLDQFTVTNGQFNITGELSSPVYASLVSSEPQYYASFWLSNGTVEVDLDTARLIEGRKNSLSPLVTGSGEQVLYDSYMDKAMSLSAPLRETYNSMQAAKDPVEKEKLQAKVDSLRDELTVKSSSLINDFIMTNNSSVVSAYLMRQIIEDHYHSVDTLDLMLNNFTDDVKVTAYYKNNKEELESLKRIQPGKEAPDFTLTDPQGKDFSFSSLKGKVVLIDFWASWCKPCIESIPSMKQVYNEYKASGFEILGVSDDMQKDAWLKAIEQNKIPWKNVIDRFPQPPAPRGPAEIASLYAIHYLPTTILVDKNGMIVAKNLHGEELVEKIKSVL